MQKNTHRNTPLLIESIVVGGIAVILEATSLVGLTYWSLKRTQQVKDEKNN